MEKSSPGDMRLRMGQTVAMSLRIAAICISAAITVSVAIVGVSVLYVVSHQSFVDAPRLCAGIAWQVSWIALLVWMVRSIFHNENLMAATLITGFLGGSSLLAGIVGVTAGFPLMFVCVMFVYGMPLSIAAALLAYWCLAMRRQSR